MKENIKKTDIRLFTTDQIVSFIESEGIVPNLLREEILYVNDNYCVHLLNANAFFEVYGLSWIGESFIENGRAKVIKSGDTEDDLLYAVYLCMKNAKKVTVCQAKSTKKQ